MEAQPAPVNRPPRPSVSNLKFQICEAIQRVIKAGAPAAWHGWDAEKTRQFIEHVQGCHTGRSLRGLSFSAQEVVIAYGLDPAEILPAEAFE